EIQKIGYRFPSQRSSCYVSDMIMRQYSRRKSETKDKGREFDYSTITPVNLFVLMEKSPSDFRSSKAYIHRRKTSYDSGIRLPETANITYITLDSFKETVENISSDLEAWLTFLIRDDMESVIRLVDTYPEFGEIYSEIAEFRRDPKELIGMFSEALYIMDKNTERHMIRDLQEEVDQERQRADEEKQRADSAEKRADNAEAVVARYIAQFGELKD
ncbi:MAG: PD-(D/E)XK nuclease family transposase, partial [Lachnospiraceae bacterium]|nr:PD-(D/E)XK nuclease family transposase [Lachnospiraceae bacterium]